MRDIIAQLAIDIWMSLLLVVGVGLVILIFLCSAAGVFMPELNEGPIVYGPPEGIGDY